MAAAEAARPGDAAQLAAFELVLELAGQAASVAFRSGVGWVGGVRAGLVALLELFDEEPALARYLVVGSVQAGPAVLARRGEVLEQVALVLDDERAPARVFPPPLTALAVVNGVLGVLFARLSEPESGVLAELADSLMSFIALPFLGARAARRELQCPRGTVRSPAAGVSVELLQDPGRRLSHRREVEVLGVLAGEPGLSNTQVGSRVGLKDPGHVSRLLARLARHGLIENTPTLGRPGSKAWRLTASGEQLHAEVRVEACTPAGMIPGLPPEFAGRLDFWAVCVLRAVAEQPWLNSSEVAARAGVDDPAQISRLLALLVGLGLVASVREIHRKGTPRVWQVTDAGCELDELIGRDAPAPTRSRALDLMSRSGGRLGEPAVTVLRVAAVEPGLSNGAIALRVGITDANSISQLLARLVGRGLIENTRDGGRENAWVLTTDGIELEDAMRQELPRPASRTVAFDLLRQASGRLNHRVASVLAAIAAEPRLSNQEIAERIGVASKAHTSTLLARLARFALIENQASDAQPFQANAWQLTASGKQLQAAIRQSQPEAKQCPPGNQNKTDGAVGCR